MYKLNTKTMNLADKLKHDYNNGSFTIPLSKSCLYDNKGNLIFQQLSSGFYIMYVRDESGNLIFYETSNKYWKKYERNEVGKVTFWEDSDGDTGGISNNKLN